MPADPFWVLLLVAGSPHCFVPRQGSRSVLFSLVFAPFPLFVSQPLLEIALFPEHQKNHPGLSKWFYCLLLNLGGSITYIILPVCSFQL